ncbi:MAG: hypothetical protein CMI01_00490 [Oceanospirillaceae bacterium]|nr:hypothetical protein [Oceanospirillaceae bacterium]
MAITCADIARLPGLETIRFRAGLQGGDRVVRWPYCAENDSIAPWVSGGELVFVTGINHRRNESNLLQLVEEAVQYDVAGLVILTGPEYIQTIPNRVLERANQVGLPILEQPYSLKLVVVTEVISNAIVQENLIGQSTRLFLTRLINGFADTPELIRLKAAELGLKDEHPYRILALKTDQCHQEVSKPDRSHSHEWHFGLNQLEQQVESLLKRRSIDWPVLRFDKDLIAIWPCDKDQQNSQAEELQAALDRVQTQLPHAPIFMGVSDLQTTLSQLSGAVEQARQALQFVVQGKAQKLFFFDQLGIARLFAAIPQRKLLSRFCEQQLGALCFAQDSQSLALKETLICYLNHFGNQQQTADTLGVHRNTLRQRLARIDQILGHSLSDPFTRLNVQNALLIEQIILQRHDL